MYVGHFFGMSGCNRAEKSTAGGIAGSGAGIGGHDISGGMRSDSCGFRRDALEVFGMRASADAKSCAVGLVRRPFCIDVRM